jgi:hypothetical protein
MREENDIVQAFNKGDDDSSESEDYALLGNTSYTTSDDDDDSETEESFSNKVRDKIGKKNKKLVTNLGYDDDETIGIPGELSKKATLFFDQPLFKKVMEEYDENKELSETRKSEYDANDNSKLTPKKNKIIENFKADDDDDYDRNFQATDKDSASKIHNKSLKRKAEEVRIRRKYVSFGNQLINNNLIFL